MTFMPAFDRYAIEAETIGRLVVGYGEIEFGLAHCVSMILNDPDRVFKAMFSVRGETRRVDRAGSLAKSGSLPSAYMSEFDAAIDDVRHCLAIRNQYAHCNWLDNYTHGLSFVNLEEIARQPALIDLGNLTQHEVSLSLLQEQATFFQFVDRTLSYLNYEAQHLGGRLRANHFQKPVSVTKPNAKVISTTPLPLVSPTKRTP